MTLTKLGGQDQGPLEDNLVAHAADLEAEAFVVEGEYLLTADVEGGPQDSVAIIHGQASPHHHELGIEDVDHAPQAHPSVECDFVQYLVAQLIALEGGFMDCPGIGQARVSPHPFSEDRSFARPYAPDQLFVYSGSRG